MLSNKEIVNIIFGLKVRYLRMQKDLSYQQLADLSGLGLSYLSEIEKGKKYPKPDKIFALASALDVGYDDLVSLRADKKLSPIIGLLNSDFVKIFPFETFGIDVNKLVELFSITPTKVNAFLNTMITIVRGHQLGTAYFYQQALRSYQDLHNNHFTDIEDVVGSLKADLSISGHFNFSKDQIEKILKDKYGIVVNYEGISQFETLSLLRSYFHEDTKTLFINESQSSHQLIFTLAKELGCQALDLQDRPYEYPMQKFKSFEGLLANFRSSYFSAAFSMPEKEMVKDIRSFFESLKWNPELLLSIIDKYNVSAEMFFQRLTNILPAHLGISDLFFLKLHATPNLKYFSITKELHLSQLHEPYANHKEEKYCRRWISIDVLKKLRTRKSNIQGDLADAQVSNYFDSKNSYLCLSVAFKNKREEEGNHSVTLGFLVTDHLRRIVNFLDDPDLLERVVNTTCERCANPDCSERAAPPVVIEKRDQQEAVFAAIDSLVEPMIQD